VLLAESFPTTKFISVPEPKAEYDVKFHYMEYDQKFNKIFVYGDMKESTHYS